MPRNKTANAITHENSAPQWQPTGSGERERTRGAGAKQPLRDDWHRSVTSYPGNEHFFIVRPWGGGECVTKNAPLTILKPRCLRLPDSSCVRAVTTKTLNNSRCYAASDFAPSDPHAKNRVHSTVTRTTKLAEDRQTVVKLGRKIEVNVVFGSFSGCLQGPISSYHNISPPTYTVATYPPLQKQSLCCPFRYLFLSKSLVTTRQMLTKRAICTVHYTSS